MRLRIIIAIAIALTVAVAACGDDDDDGETTTPDAATGTAAPDGIAIVATTSQIADMAAHLTEGIDGVRITTLVAAGVDPHSYEPSSSELRAVSEADIILRHGLGLDEFLDAALDSAGDAAITTVTDGIATIGDDPHVWFDVQRARQMAESIGEALIEADPANDATYQENADVYLAELDRLHDFVRSEADRVPTDCRKLVTDHPVLFYFAAAYDYQIVATLLPGDPEGEPSAGELARVIEAIEREGVPAVFGQGSESGELVERAADEAGVVAVTDLYLDTLGPEGSGAETYIGMMEHNTRRIVAALEGCLG